MFDSLFSLFSHDLGIDLGTANTLVYVKGKGITVREPSIVARHNKTKQIIATGAEAKKMLGKTPAAISAIRPLQHGVISDFDAASYLISHYIKKIHEFGTPIPQLARPRVAVGIPSGITEVERRAVWEAVLNAGARECFLIEEPMAAAIGADVSVFEPTGALIVDVGGGTTEIAVISLGGIVVNKSLRIAGDEMDQAIINYLRLKNGMLFGERTAENLKIKIGSAYKKNSKPIRQLADQNPKLNENKEKKEEKSGEKVMIVSGRDIETGLPKSIRVSETEIREAIGPVINQIVDAITEVIEETPPELTTDILQHGIILTGGGSLLSGFDDLIVERTKIPVIIAEDPLTTVVRGTAKLLEDKNLLNRVKVTGGLR